MKHIRPSRTLVLVVTVWLALALALAVTPAHGAVRSESSRQVNHPQTPWMKRACRYEDGVNCFWDASRNGNHKGHSFYVRQFPGSAEMICVMYVRAKDARRWDYCEAVGATPTGRLANERARGKGHWHDIDLDGYGE